MITSYWGRINERLIRRGTLILDLKFVRRYSDEIREINEGKRGRPFKITNSYVEFLAVFRYVFVRFRQLEGFTISLRRMFHILPSIDYSWIRRRVLRLGIDLRPLEALKESREPVVIVLDSTGVKAHRAGSWLERRYGKRRRYVKMHVAVNARTGEIIDVEMMSTTLRRLGGWWRNQ
ncbi:MAG: transposase [Candidatus Caldarchaeum sp.]